MDPVTLNGITQKDLRQEVRRMLEGEWELTSKGDGRQHFVLRHEPTGAIVRVSSTSGDRNVVHALRRAVRRALRDQEAKP